MVNRLPGASSARERDLPVFDPLTHPLVHRRPGIGEHNASSDGSCIGRSHSGAGRSAVANLVAEESEEEPSTPVGELRAERMRLLDGLRP